MMTMTNLIEAIEALNGADVRIFGQPQVIDDSVDDFTLNTIDILKALESYDYSDEMSDDYYDEDEDGNEVFVEGELTQATRNAYDERISHSWDDDFEYMQLLEDYGVIYGGESADNTYNWSAPLNHHIDYRYYKCSDGGVIVFLQVHRFGDVRGNYEGFSMLHFDCIESFYEIISECNKTAEVEIDGDTYYAEISFFSDSYEVYNDNWDYVCTAYGDEDDVIECIKEAIA